MRARAELCTDGSRAGIQWPCFSAAYHKHYVMLWYVQRGEVNKKKMQSFVFRCEFWPMPWWSHPVCMRFIRITHIFAWFWFVENKISFSAWMCLQRLPHRHAEAFRSTEPNISLRYFVHTKNITIIVQILSIFSSIYGATPTFWKCL